MAKYDWKQLEKEYILSDSKSVSKFIKNKEIPYNGTTKTKTKGWSNKKRLKQDQKATKVIEKTIEKEAEIEATQIADLKSIANGLALKITQSMTELNRHIARNKKKTKTVEYNNEIAKPTKETIEEQEEILSYIDIIDRQGLKQLTSALKDLNDIVNNKQEESNPIQSLASLIQQAYEQKAGDK